MNELERLQSLLEAREVLDDQIRKARWALGMTKKRPRGVIPECGTESAYQRHRHYGEETDAACKAAHAEYNRLRSAG